MISVCVITKNEERHLERCLSSVKYIADEIVVVDSGSSDDTLRIAKSYQSKIKQIEWRDDYSYARNIAIDLCEEPWILFLDADETLENESRLVENLNNADEAVGGFVMARHDSFLNLETGKRTCIPIGLVRIFRNVPEIRFVEPVHEIVSPSIVGNGWRLSVLKKEYIHHHIDLHPLDFLKFKQNKYLQIINQNLSVNEENWWLVYQKAKTLWFFGEFGKAFEIFSILKENSTSIELRTAALNNLAVLCASKEEYDTAIGFITTSLSFIPDQSQAYFILGDILLKQSKPLEAFRAFQKVKTTLHLTKMGSYIPGGLYLFNYQKNYRLALCMANLGIGFLARYFLSKALNQNPDYVDALFLRANLYKKTGSAQKANKLISRIREINPEWSRIAEFELTSPSDLQS